MLFRQTLALVAPLLALSSPTVESDLHARQAYSLVGTGFDNDTKILGNYYNYWSVLPNGTVDLTRSNTVPVTTPKTLPMWGARPEIIIEPTRSALVIIDMQNYFLHPQLSPNATAGRAAVAPTVNMINGFRANGMKVLWTNWGLTGYDRLTIPPAFLSSFSANGFNTMGSNLNTQTFGGDMGTIVENGTTINVGRKLFREAWNAEPYGVLKTMKDEGLAAGTDLYFNKNRFSGLWGPQTPLGLWLQENEITTLFFGGVNTDQCVWGTLVDAYFKGYDVVFVDDICGTTSPQFATDMCRYNADLNGFLGNSSDILAALS